jgi:hypothetical protein
MTDRNRVRHHFLKYACIEQSKQYLVKQPCSYIGLKLFEQHPFYCNKIITYLHAFNPYNMTIQVYFSQRLTPFQTTSHPIFTRVNNVRPDDKDLCTSSCCNSYYMLGMTMVTHSTIFKTYLKPRAERRME